MHIEWKSIGTTLNKIHSNILYILPTICDNKKEKQQMNFYEMQNDGIYPILCQVKIFFLPNGGDDATIIFVLS